MKLLFWRACVPAKSRDQEGGKATRQKGDENSAHAPRAGVSQGYKSQLEEQQGDSMLWSEWGVVGRNSKVGGLMGKSSLNLMFMC